MMVGRFRKYIASDRYSYGLRRDLTLPITMTAAKIPIFVRTLRSSDIPILLPDPMESQAPSHAHIVRRQFIEMGIDTAYVAATQDGIPCYVQWLIGPGENEKIQKCFGGLLPWLGPDEILLDQAFTLEPFRGLGIMSCAMSQISEIGRGNGARWALALVAEDNIAAMKGCQRAGFRPYLIRRESWRLLQRGISFHLLPRGTPYPFDEVKGAVADRLSLAG